MEAPAFLRQIPAYFHDAIGRVEAFGNKIKEIVAQLGQRIGATAIWIHLGSLYLNVILSHWIKEIIHS